MESAKALLKLGKRTKALRIERGLTQADLAAAINTDLQTIDNLENGLYNAGMFELK
jgi:DNA-binding XRE family transcriptional regulator